MHEQSSWEITYVVQGEGIRQISDFKEPFGSGDVVLIPPKIRHCWIFSKNGTDKHKSISNITLTYEQSFLEKCHNIFPEMRSCIERLRNKTEAVVFRFKRATQIRQALIDMRKATDAERIALVINIIIYASETDDGTTIKTGKRSNNINQKLADIKTFVHCNSKRTISLDDIANHVGMNRTGFCIFFKRRMGITFIEYLNNYRIEQACKLLKENNMHISEICYEVGFNNICHFNRVFRKTEGCTPTEYCANAHK